MSAIPGLKWTEHHQGEGRQMWQAKAGSGFYKVMQLECKNKHGNEWQLLFDFKESPHFGESLYYETVDEAKSKAERDNFGCELKYFEFTAETVGGNLERKQEVWGKFACLLSEIDPADPERQLRETLASQKNSLRLIAPSKVSESFLQTLPDDLQPEIFRELNDKGYWLDIIGVH
jgi:hypothetical protein